MKSKSSSSGKQQSQQKNRSKPSKTVGDAPTQLLLQRALSDPALLSSTEVLQLQRTIGNKAVTQLLTQKTGPTTPNRPTQITSPQATVQRKWWHWGKKKKTPVEKPMVIGGPILVSTSNTQSTTPIQPRSVIMNTPSWALPEYNEEGEKPTWQVREELAEERRRERMRVEYLLEKRLKRGITNSGPLTHVEMMKATAFLDELSTKPKLDEEARKGAREYHEIFKEKHPELPYNPFADSQLEREGEFRDPRDVMAEVDNWLLGEADKVGYGTLLRRGGYQSLTIDQKTRVFIAAGVPVNINDPESYKRLKTSRTGWRKSISWSRFALEVRRETGNKSVMDLVSSMNPTHGTSSVGENPYADTMSDYIGYGTAIAGGVGKIGSGINTKIEDTGTIGDLVGVQGEGNLTGMTGTAHGLTLTTSALSIIGSINTLTNAPDTFANKTKLEQAFSALPGVLIELANIAENTSKGIAEISMMSDGLGSLAQIGFSEGGKQVVAQGALASTAVAAMSIAAIVGGTLKIGKGVFDFAQARKISTQLQDLKVRLQDDDFQFAIARAEKTMSLKKKYAGLAIAQGTAMVVGGALLLAFGASNPFGWLVLAFGGVIGACVAIHRFYMKRKQGKAFVKDIYRRQKGLDEGADVKDTELDEWLMSLGYPKGAALEFHNEFMYSLSHSIHQEAFNEEGDRRTAARELLSSIGLVPDDEKKTPTPQQIATRLRNP